MVKILAGLMAAVILAVVGYFGIEFYVQQRVAREVDAAFAAVRASGAKASHGKVGFDLWSRTITVADVAGESAAQPPVAVKIGRFTAAGVNQPEAARFTAERIDATGVEVSGTMAVQTGLRFSYSAPRVEVVNFAGPAGPLRRLDTAAPADIYRFMLEHFAATSAASATIPSVTARMTATDAGAPAPGAGDYTYSGLALRDMRDGKIGSTTMDRVAFTAVMDIGGKKETLTGEAEKIAAHDFDAAATVAILDPARANDDKYYRAYRQMTAGPYTVSFASGLRMRIDGLTVDEIALRPSRLQYPQLIAIVNSAPPTGTTPTPAQMRDMLEKVAGIYEGLRVGNAEVRGLAMETPDGPFRLGAIRLVNLEAGKIGEFAVEGLEARSAQGPVKVGRFALRSFDVANLLRMSAQFSAPGQQPSQEQLFALLALLEGTELKDLVAPYKDAANPVNVETLDVSWGQFVGPLPTKARVAMKMSGPVDASDPDPFKMLAAAGISSATINIDLGAAWTEGTRSFALDPVTLEIGSVAAAAARLTLGNVPREAFSLNPLQATLMAAQVEAGPVELSLRDTGGVDLAVAQYARTQNVSREAARQAIIDNVRTNAMTMAAANPDVMAIAGAVTRFVETPGGTLRIKLAPRGKVALMELIEAMRSDPIAALARFDVQATAAR